MIAFVTMILKQFVTGWELVQTIIIWAWDNQYAALFWGSVWCYLLDRFFKWTKNTTDDALWDALKTAIITGYSKVKGNFSVSK
jgi:hypothetical protein